MIVPMTLDHASQVANLEKLCFADPWSLNSITSEVENPLAHWLVFLEGEQVVGYIGSQTVLGESDIMNVGVHPDHRKQGIARKLLSRLESDLKAQDVTVIALEVRPSNLPAVTLYTTCGYVQVGRRPNYYRNPKEDGLILKKELTL